MVRRACPNLVVRKSCLDELDWLPVVFNDCHVKVLHRFIRPQQKRLAGDSAFQVVYFERDMRLRFEDRVQRTCRSKSVPLYPHRFAVTIACIQIEKWTVPFSRLNFARWDAEMMKATVNAIDLHRNRLFPTEREEVVELHLAPMHLPTAARNAIRTRRPDSSSTTRMPERWRRLPE